MKQSSKPVPRACRPEDAEPPRLTKTDLRRGLAARENPAAPSRLEPASNDEQAFLLDPFPREKTNDPEAQ